MISGCPQGSLNVTGIKSGHNLQARLLRPVGHAVCQRPFTLRHRNRTFSPVRAVNKDEGQLAVQSPLKRLQTRLLGEPNGAFSTGSIVCISVLSCIQVHMQFRLVSSSLSMGFCRTSGAHAVRRGQGTQLQSGGWSMRCCVPDMLHRQSLDFSGNSAHGRAVWLVRLCERSHQQLLLSWLHRYQPDRYNHGPKATCSSLSSHKAVLHCYTTMLAFPKH